MAQLVGQEPPAPTQTTQSPQGTSGVSAAADPAPVASPTMIPRDIAVLRLLDKISARTTVLRIPSGSSAAFGLIVITVRSCQEAPPSEAPESAAFLEISEIDIASLPRSGVIPSNVQPARLLFSGWMFASSPALSALEHPTYDVTVTGCESRSLTPAQQAATGEEGPVAPTTAMPAAPAAAVPGADPALPQD